MNVDRKGYHLKHFEVVINGQNIRMNVDSETKLLGFYTTCFVAAESKQEAEQLSLNRVRSRLDAPLPSSSEEPLWKAKELDLVVDEITPIHIDEMDEDSGFAWYEEE